MLILAIDTTTRGGSIAVVDDDTLLALVHGDETRTHAERLPAEVAAALDAAGVARSALDLLAVASGPGAFTGLRIGLATVQGLALTLGRPTVGVSALDALAWNTVESQMSRIPGAREDADGADHAAWPERGGEVRSGESKGAPDDPDSHTTQHGRLARRPRSETASPTSEAILMAPWMDAQRGEVFAALYSRSPAASPSAGVFPWTVLEPAVTSAPATLLEEWRARFAGQAAVFVGDAALRDAVLIAEAGAGLWRPVASGPLAPAIARIGRRMALAGQAGPPHALAPIYVRRPDAEIERERRGGR